jgi:hypothetical protein
MAVTIITRWESTQMEPMLEWRMWKQMRDAFRIKRFIFTPIMPEMNKIDIEQCATMEEALAIAQDDGEFCFLEPLGKKTVDEIPKEHDGDVVLILGDSTRDNLALADEYNTYRIETHGRYGHLYGINAAAIAMAMRFKPDGTDR